MALNTNGWDLIYNIKLTKANEQLNSKFNIDTAKELNSFKQLNDLNDALANEMADGFAINNAITMHTQNRVAEFKGTNDPTPNILSTQSAYTKAELKMGDGGILHININGYEGRNNIKNTDFELTGFPNDIKFNIWLRIKSVAISPNDNSYNNFPKFTLSGGGITVGGAILNMITGDTNIERFDIANPGEKYTSTPILNLVGGDAIKEATVTVMMEPYIEIIEHGNITVVPTGITLKDKIQNKTYPTTVELLKTHVHVTTQGTYSNAFLLPPIVYLDGTLKTGFLHPLIFASFKFSNPTLQIVSNDVKASIKKCFGAGIKSIIKNIDSTINTINNLWVDTKNNYIPTKEPDSSKIITLKDYCLALVDDFLTRLYENNKDYAQGSVLKMIRKNIKYNANTTAYSKANIVKFEPAAINLLKAYARFFPDTKTPSSKLNENISTTDGQKAMLEKLMEQEKELIKNRVLSNVLWIDDQIFYKLDGTEITIDEFQLSSNEERFITCMIQIVKSLVPNPWHYSFKSCTIENKDSDDKDSNGKSINTILTSTSRKYDRLKLITGPLQLREGGSENILKMVLPIRKLVAILGEKSVVYPTPSETVNQDTPSDVGTYKLPLIVNASWLRSGFKKDFKSLLSNSVSIDLTDAELDSVLKDKNIFNIEDNNSLIIVKACLHRLINESLAQEKYGKYNNLTVGLNLYDEYLAMFNELLMPYSEALGKPDLAWMFPTSYNIAVKDDTLIPTNISNSVLSLCCMINGNRNSDIGYVDINAIPEGASSTLVIERGVFGENMVVPIIGKDIIPQFDNSEKMEFDKLSSYSFINNIDAKLTNADFKTSLSYLGLLPILDWAAWLIGYPVYHGTVFKKMANVTINQDNINLRLKDVKYMFSFENYPKVSQEYITTLKYEGVKLKVSVQLVDAAINYFHTDFWMQAIITGYKVYKDFKSDNDGDSSQKNILDYFQVEIERKKDAIEKIHENIQIESQEILKEIDSWQLNNEQINEVKKFKNTIENLDKIIKAELNNGNFERAELKVEREHNTVYYLRYKLDRWLNKSPSNRIKPRPMAEIIAEKKMKELKVLNKSVKKLTT